MALKGLAQSQKSIRKLYRPPKGNTAAPKAQLWQNGQRMALRTLFEPGFDAAASDAAESRYFVHLFQ